MLFQHDIDDPPPGPDYWGFLNRWAEECLRFARRYLGLLVAVECEFCVK
jgi:hypothetical protein